MNPLNINSYIVHRTFNTPLLIEEQKATTISNYLLSRIASDDTAYDIEHEEDINEQVTPSTENRIAIIPVVGTLIHRGGFMDARSGVLSYKALRQQIKEAADDPNINKILLDIDSPGGEVEGNFTLAEFIRGVDENIKPVYAIANGSAYSGAFSIGVAAREFYVTETGGVGSVGVIMQHVDFSQANAKQGIDVTNITFGDKKDQFSSDSPLSSEAKQELQDRVNELGSIFAKHVALMRNIPLQSVIDTKAGLLFGQEAVNIGFVDGVASFEDLLQHLMDEPDTPQITQGTENMFRKNNKERMSTDDAATEAEAPEAEANEAEANKAEATEAEATEAEANEAEASNEQEQADPLAAAAEIADLAHKAGMSHMTSSYIKAGFTPEQVQSKLDASERIEALCKLARKEDAAASYISEGKTYEQVQEALFAEMNAADDATEVSNKPNPEQVEEDFATAGNVLMQDAEKRADAAANVKNSKA